METMITYTPFADVVSVNTGERGAKGRAWLTGPEESVIMTFWSESPTVLSQMIIEDFRYTWPNLRNWHRKTLCQTLDIRTVLEGMVGERVIQGLDEVYEKVRNHSYEGIDELTAEKFDEIFERYEVFRDIEVSDPTDAIKGARFLFLVEEGFILPDDETLGFMVKNRLLPKGFVSPKRLVGCPLSSPPHAP